MYDIITFGSATHDMFLKSKEFKVVAQKRFITRSGLCMSLGSKIPVQDLEYATGGGGTNTAASFAYQGFKVAYCGKVGNDSSGQAIIDEMKKLGASTELIVVDKKKKTNCSVILSVPGTERTILVFRDCSEKLGIKDVPWKKVKNAKWMYICPLSGELVKIFLPLIKFAKKNKIKVALNPGNTQFELPKKNWETVLKSIDVLILNQEEAAMLTGAKFENESGIFKKLSEMSKSIIVMTKGPAGLVVSDGKFKYSAGILKEKVMVDRTGAGDAFGSGFLSGFIRKSGDIPYAIQFGSANATGCIEKFGAKNGILKKGDSIYQRGKLKITKSKI